MYKQKEKNRVIPNFYDYGTSTNKISGIHNLVDGRYNQACGTGNLISGRYNYVSGKNNMIDGFTNMARG